MVEAAGFCFTGPEGGLDACGLEGLEAVAGNGGVGVDGGDNYAGEAGGDEGRGARRSAAGVVARLEGYVGGAVFYGFFGMLCGFQSGDFGVVAEVVLVPAFAGWLAVSVEEDAAYGGVGRSEGEAAAGEGEGAVHPVEVGIDGCAHRGAGGTFKFTWS